MKKFFIILGMVATLSMSTAPLAFASEQLDTSFLPKGLPTLSGEKAREDISFDLARMIVVRRLLNIVSGSIAIVATFFVILSGMRLVISNGNDDKMGPAKKGLTWALVGLVMIALSYSIMSFIIRTALTAEDPQAQGEMTDDRNHALTSDQESNMDQINDAFGKALESADQEAAAEADAREADFTQLQKQAADATAEFNADKENARTIGDPNGVNVNVNAM